MSNEQNQSVEFFTPEFIGHDKLLELKERAIKADPLLKKVKMSEIRLTGLSEAIPYVELFGKKLRVANSFISDLCNQIGISSKLQKKFEKNPEISEFRDSVMTAIKRYVVKTGGNKEVLLVGSSETKHLEGIKKVAKNGRLPNASVFRIIEDLLAGDPSLRLESLNYSMDGSIFMVNILDPTPVDMTQYGEEEMFMFGFTIGSTPTESYISPYNMRLSCLNGMSAHSNPRDTNLQMGLSNEKTILLDVNQLNDHLAAMKIAAEEADSIPYAPDWFEPKLEAAGQVYASYREVESIFKWVCDHVQEEDKDLKEQIFEKIKAEYFYGLSATEQRIAKQEHFLSDIKKDDLRFLRTPMKIWDLINEITYLASNPSKHGLPFKEKFYGYGKGLGGMLLKKDFDLQRADIVRTILTL
jgi:hypothetical protein